ncbi:MAG: hypothetical protein IPQ09_30805 [Myxococcales bacterium]|nr:hypothetical protein [Myxococcales bacterium]
MRDRAACDATPPPGAAQGMWSGTSATCAHTGVVHYEILRQSGEEAARQRDEARAELARLTALDRATDDELVDLYRKIYETHGGGTISVSHDDCRRAGVRTLAARVRKERCLVAQAVGMGAGVTASRTSERVPGTTGMWDVYVTRRPDVPGDAHAGVPPPTSAPWPLLVAQGVRSGAG